MKYIFGLLLICLTYGSVQASEPRGLYNIIAHTSKSCKGMPKQFSFTANFLVDEDCKDYCNVLVNSVEIKLKKLDRYTFLFTTDNNKSKIKTTYIVRFFNAHLNGMGMVDKIGNCTVIYFVDGERVK